VEADVDFERGLLPGFSKSADRTWVDPIIGANVSYELTKRWSLDARGMIGGFGVSADLAAEVFAGVTYHATDWFSATAGYRYLYEDYSRNHYSMNLDAQGFLLGFGFRF
jgi:outer membrane receptor protein involved in Fe transport